MPDIKTVTTVHLSPEELAEAVVDYVAKLHGGDLPAMDPKTLKVTGRVFCDDEPFNTEVQAVGAVISTPESDHG